MFTGMTCRFRPKMVLMDLQTDPVAILSIGLPGAILSSILFTLRRNSNVMNNNSKKTKVNLSLIFRRIATIELRLGSFIIHAASANAYLIPYLYDFIRKFR